MVCQGQGGIERGAAVRWIGSNHETYEVMVMTLDSTDRDGLLDAWMY
jgi:hypothetical protein